jgi:hypothetical protein
MLTFLQLAATNNAASRWYENAWVIGIATGVLSGALIAIVTPIFLRSRRKRDIDIKRDRAAEDVLSALRPAVATGNLPPASVVEAIARAAVFKRGLTSEQAAPTLVLLDMLISEVMASAFLDSEVRLSLSKKLVSLESDCEGGQSIAVVATQEPEVVDYRSITTVISILGAVTIGLVSVWATTFRSYASSTFWILGGALAGILLLFAAWQFLDSARRQRPQTPPIGALTKDSTQTSDANVNNSTTASDGQSTK